MSSLFGIGGGGNVGAAGGFYSYSIDQSLRFNDNDGAYLSKAFSTTQTNDKLITVSVWFKLGNLKSTASRAVILHARNGGAGEIRLQSDKLQANCFDTGYVGFRSEGLFRDTAAWYHIVYQGDSTNATASDRNRVWLNGQELTNAATSFPPQNTVLNVLKTGQTTMVGRNVDNAAHDWDGYLAEMHVIDGSLVDVSNFGETINGVWVPKNVSGLTYGTNGFYLSFADSAAIGDDLSGNTNDFTANNLAASDVVPDSPTNNWCINNGAMRANITHSEGNLKMVGVGGNFDNMAGTFLFDVEDTDGWYWEGYVNSGGAEVRFGISKPQNIYFNQSDPTFNFAHSSDGIAYKGSGSISTGGTDSSYGDSFTTGDVIGIAVKAGALYFYKNGSIQNSGTAAATGLTGQYVPAVSINSTLSLSTNYGQDSTFAGAVTAGGNTDANGYGDFKYSVPSGYKALCSANLPEPAIGPNSAEQADDYFNTVLYTGDGTAIGSGGQAITGVGFQSDWTWIKRRDAAGSHSLYDVVRGAEKLLQSEKTDAEVTLTEGLSSFDSDGFTVGNHVNHNNSSATYAAWNWKAGGTAVSNTDGSITSSVSAAPDAGFSIVSFTCGSGVTSGTVGHGLGVQPQLIIGKTRNHAVGWYVHTPLLAANLTGAFDTAAWYDPGYNHWNDTHPTDTVFSVGGYMAGHADLTSPSTKICYCFANVEGFSKVGKYVGNGSADGTFVYTGFRPAWVMVKGSSFASNWNLFDATRNPFNITTQILRPNLSAAEFDGNAVTGGAIDIVSNGFKIRKSDADVNTSSATFIYLAFAEAPFKYANAR